MVITDYLLSAVYDASGISYQYALLGVEGGRSTFAWRLGVGNLAGPWTVEPVGEGDFISLDDEAMAVSGGEADHLALQSTAVALLANPPDGWKPVDWSNPRELLESLG